MTYPEIAPRVRVRVNIDGPKKLALLEPAVTAVLAGDDDEFVVRATPQQQSLLERMTSVTIIEKLPVRSF